MDQYYRHFRNRKLYHILEYATIESTEEEAVVYEAMYDDHRVWIRPKSNFFEEVSFEGKMVPRFQPVPHEEIQEELDREFDRELEEVKTLHKQITDELHALYSDAELRVAKNSLRMKSVQEAVDEGWVALDMLQDQLDNISLLDKYYAEEWKSDFEADEKGELNKNRLIAKLPWIIFSNSLEMEVSLYDQRTFRYDTDRTSNSSTRGLPTLFSARGAS